jgi:3-hydroxyacyl-[acyl-carrier-protein] dehydratase
MRFNLLDRITEVQPGRSLRAVKNLTLAEEYLADHFPSFPVLPGVLMLQGLVEAGSWLLRLTEDYRHSVIVLREVRNIKYGTFVEPGRQLSFQVDLAERGDHVATFKGKGEVEGQSAVSARLVLATYNLRDRAPALASNDERIVRQLREQAGLLCHLPGGASAGAAGGKERGAP